VLPTLRHYQKICINDTYTHIRAGEKKILLFSPTGSGKTVTASQIIAHAVSRGRRVMMLVHREPLINQTYDKLCSFGIINCGFIKSGRQENRNSLIQIASIQTLPNRNWWHDFPADLVILDECHITSYASVVQQMMSEVYTKAIYLGLTATPWRLNKHEALGDIFRALVCAPMPYQLIEQGYLVKPSYFSITQADLEKVGVVNDGDFDEAELALVFNTAEMIQDAVQHWKRLAYGRRTIAFTVNVAHAQQLCSAFQSAGIPSAYVDGKTPVKLTDQIYQQLADASILVLCSCMKLVEGFDLPSISAVLSCRSTLSKALYHQMIGRGLRLSPETGKTDCIIIDQAGNVKRHGPIEALKQISLDLGQERQALNPPMKNCPLEQGGCSAILYAIQMKCPHCGYVFLPPPKAFFVPQLEQVLSEEDCEKYEFYRQQIRAAYQQNFAPGWAVKIFQENYGYWPPDSWTCGGVFGDSPTLAHQNSYYGYLKAIAQRKEKPDTWIKRHMELEFGFNYRECLKKI